MLIAALAVLCALLTLALLVQRPAGWPALAVLVVLWGIGICVFRYQLRRWTAAWMNMCATGTASRPACARH